MKIPFSWLKEYVDIDVTPQELEEKLFGCGFEVEELIDIGKDISNVVVGKVLECEPIPETHLHVCKVDAGTGEILQICCGADNVRVGGVYPIALPGATVIATAKDHKTVEGVATIKKGKMRGYESNGMLCSGTELGINDDMFPGAEYFGLLELPEDSVIGADIKPIVGLNDYIFDISITANRSDCQSVLGMAREVAAVLAKPLKMPAIDYTASDYIYEGLDVTVEDGDLCPRYLAHGVRNITPGPSPLWLKRRLALCGLRSISNVVDITNYVMLEIGQPMHAFDMSTLESTKIIVRRAKQDEIIVTLDEQEYKLSTENLVICDGTKPVALAGVMGGLNSEITDSTSQLLFESAKFARDNIRKTSRSLGKSTDASSHYEKGISEYTTELGMARALHLIEELGCGEITSSEFDCSAGASREGLHFKASLSRINAILGIEVPADAVMDILARLSFTVERNGDELDVIAPRWREDIEIGEPDLAEEIIREYGYDKIVPTFLDAAKVTNGGLSPAQQNRAKMKRSMCAQGFTEISTLGFYSDADLDRLHIPAEAPERSVIRLLNPISSNLTIMRPLLAPSVLNVVVENLKRGNNIGRIFEMGNVYVPKQLPVKELPNEVLHMSFAAFGEGEDFFTVKGAVEGIAESFGVEFDFVRASDVSYLHPGISAYIVCRGKTVGVFGKLSNAIVGELDLPKDSKVGGKIFIGEINYAALAELFPNGIHYSPISEYPTVSRDLALIAEENVECGAIIAEIKNSCKQIGDVELFDIYRSEPLGAGKKSMAFKISFVPSGAPLSAEDVERFVKKILGNLKFRLGIEMR